MLQTTKLLFLKASFNSRCNAKKSDACLECITYSGLPSYLFFEVVSLDGKRRLMVYGNLWYKVLNVV